MNALPSNTFSRRVLWLSLVVHLLSAVMNREFLFDDEAQTLQWIREGLGPDSIFGIPLTLRIAMALVGWWVTVGLVRACETWFPDKQIQKTAVVATSLAWFLPSIHSRFSAENVGAVLFFLGFLPLVAYVTENRRGNPPHTPKSDFAAQGLWIGGLWGIAFQWYPPTGVLILTTVLWLFRYANVSSKIALGFIAGITLSIGLGTDIHHWENLQWTLPGPEAAFWGYFEEGVLASPPLGLILILGTLAGWLSARRFSLTWLSLVFVVVHSVLPNKEMRSLYPILPVLPIVAVMSIQKSNGVKKTFLHPQAFPFWIAVLICNSFYLLAFLFYYGL